MACHHAPGGLQDLLDEIWGQGGKRLWLSTFTGLLRVNLPSPEASAGVGLPEGGKTK